MRCLILVLALLVLALAACSQPPEPQAPLVHDVQSPTMRYICSVVGEEGMIYTTSQGEEMAPMPTGRRCDYARFHRMHP